MSSSAFEDRWRLCRDVVNRQTIPDSRCSHAEDSIADSFQSGAPDDQFVTRRGSESVTWVIVDCPLQVSRQVFWCRAIAAAEHKNCQTERNTFWDVQPVQITQQRCNMVVISAVAHQSCCRDEHWLQTILQASRLRNDLYCVEWDVKLYYTIPYLQASRFSDEVYTKANQPCSSSLSKYSKYASESISFNFSNCCSFKYSCFLYHFTLSSNFCSFIHHHRPMPEGDEF